MAKQRLVVLDGKSVFYRGYYAMPNLATKDGRPTGGVYGFCMMALEILKRFEPDYVCVAWDKPKTNIRRRTKIYPDYKANRKPAPPDFYAQVPILHEVLEALGWPLYEIDDHEADDIMGTFAEQAKKKNIETILISSDKDLFQLLNGGTKVAALKKGLTDVEMYDSKHFEQVFDMTPAQFIDYKALMGDPSDNLPGVAGVGQKTAKQLILDYGSLDSVYKNLDKIKPAIRAKLEKNKQLAYISQELVILDLKVPIKLDWEQSAINNLDPEKLNQKLYELEFRTLIKQLPQKYQRPDKAGETTVKLDKEITTVLTSSDLPDLASAKELIIYSLSADKHQQNLKYLVISDFSHAWAIDIDEVGSGAVKKWADQLNDKPIVSYDTKQVLKALLWLGDIKPKVHHDIKVGAFILSPLTRDLSLTGLARAEIGYDGEEFENIHIDDFLNAGSKFIAVIDALYRAQIKQFKAEPKLEKLANEIEWPVIATLAEMEQDGIKLDSKYLKDMSRKFDDKISDITQQIYGLADQEFNISSPTQLAEILYDKLNLPTNGVKKGKTGYSTAVNELEKLVSIHPIIEHIMTYRELTKLKNTYIDTLPEQVDSDGRIRTTFSLTTAQTGRLSSHDPNLQNIPVRSELGRDIRRAFVAEKGHVFISADYSQFELRLAAEIAGDDELIESFNDGLDVHTRTAAQLYGLALEDVTKEQRDHAKVVNFGILYGMSPHGLSRATGMSPVEAKEFIDRYFELRQPIVNYISATKEKALNDGYVETLFGRRRPTPDVKSSNYVVREAAYRAAVNMPIQGTEADIMKMAMVEIEKRIDEDVRQLLQIHDSILLECPEDKANSVGKLVQAVMEGIVRLKVNLDVEVATAKNWGDL